jgi:hypothetical protein
VKLKARIIRVRRLFRALILIASTLLLIVVGGLLLLCVAFSDFKFPILPQECNGTSVRLTGVVEGISGATVIVKGDSSLYRGSSPIDLTLITDANGRFDSGNNPLPLFLCEGLQITVSADSFETWQLHYFLFDHFSEDELVVLMNARQPIPISLEIELEEANDV